MANEDREESKQSVVRKTYAKGRYDGGIEAYTNMGLPMNESKYRAAESGLTTTARKVFSVLDTERMMAVHEVIRELREKQLIGNPDKSTIDACLMQCVKAGLVKHSTLDDKFQKVYVRKTVLATALSEAMNPAQSATLTPVVQDNTEDPMDRLARCANTLRSIAKELEDIAIGAAERMAEIKKESDKLRQLKDLLGSIK